MRKKRTYFRDIMIAYRNAKSHIPHIKTLALENQGRCFCMQKRREQTGKAVSNIPESDETKKELTGRKRIFTDETAVDRKNIISVLQDALIVHAGNAADMQFLLQYEKGNQPLVRKKEIRPDIDIRVTDNVANEITEFKLGYNWGNPITLVQRGNKDMNGSNPSKDDMAISMLNEMLDFESMAAKDQELARYIEICGIGHRMIDIKKDYFPGGSVFDVITLNPLFTFVVYSNDALRKPVMACTYRTNKKTGDSFYTCFTRELRFEIKNQIRIVNGREERKFSFGNRSGEKNPLGMIPIVEYIRSFDRMGCFERHISDMNALNVLISDFTNNVAQNVQNIWWGNDFDLPVDPETNEPAARSGMWILTKSAGQGVQPNIKPLADNFDYEGVLANIRYRHDSIMKKAKVPLTSDPGGGSTGSAMSMSSGWSAAEVDACKEEQIIRQGKQQETMLVLQAIKKSPDTPADSPLLNINLSDVSIRIIRNKTYDMATKANTFATYVSHGINGRHALQVIDAFPDVAQTWLDSRETIEEYQKSVISPKSNNGNAEDKPNSDRIMPDLSDQKDNSPIVAEVN